MRLIKHTTLLAVTALPILIAMPMVARAQSNTETLTLFAKQNQGGDKRVITGNETDLKTARADNFAFSLKAEGRWEVCMDPGFRAGCKIVEGAVADLGGDGGSISSVRFIGPAGKATTTAKPATFAPSTTANPIPVPEQAYVYATDYYDIKPELTVSAFSDAVQATYVASQSPAELQALYERGRYGVNSGTIDAQFTGNALAGYWVEDGRNVGLSVYCDTERDGTHSYGRFVLRFNADRSAFKGMRSSCDEDPDSTGYAWDGKLVRRTAIAAIAPAKVKAPASASSAGASTSRGASSSAASRSGQSSQSNAAERLAREAGSEAERRSGDEVRKGVNRAIDGLLGRPF